MRSADAAIARLCDPAAEVSAHYVICERGRVTQLVDEAQRAWHAGAGAWGAITDVNSHSIGIELANFGDHPFAEAQMAALEALLPAIMQRWAIPASGVIGHSDMAPGRKIDPGARFDWARLARAGLALWPEGARQPGEGVDATSLDTTLMKIGFSADVAPDHRLAAFRLRMRYGQGGPADAHDLALARGWLAALNH